MSDGGGRLLRSRKGHSAPPIGCQFYGSSGQLILTTGWAVDYYYTDIIYAVSLC